MADPVTASAVILAINELGPPIAKESIASHIRRSKEYSDLFSRLCKAAGLPDTFATVSSALHSISATTLICSAVEGTVKGIKKYSES